MLIEGQAGRFMQRVFGQAVASLTNLGSVRISQAEESGDEMTRAGLRYHMSAQGATGIAPVQALPSTAAQWLIYNPLSNPVAAVIDRVGGVNATGVAGAGGTLLAVIVPPKFAPTTVPVASAANVQIMNANGVSAKASSLVVASGQTLQSAAVGNWFPIAVMNPLNTLLGQAVFDSTGFTLKGALVIPPGCGIGLAVISPTGTTPLFTPFASWREYAADME